MCVLVCWFSVGAGNQGGTIDPWPAEERETEEEEEEWLGGKKLSNQREGIGMIERKKRERMKRKMQTISLCVFVSVFRHGDPGGETLSFHPV